MSLQKKVLSKDAAEVEVTQLWRDQVTVLAMLRQFGWSVFFFPAWVVTGGDSSLTVTQR